MVLILGIDPGLAVTGWGVIRSEGNSLNYVASGVIKTLAEENIVHRLKYIFEQIDQLVVKYAPDRAAIEETFVNVNAKSSLKLGQVRGAIMVGIAKHGVDIAEYAPNLVKKSIVGFGKADKNQMIHMVKVLLPGTIIKIADEADAVAIAICDANHRRISGRVIK
jgi:crossover junction endodeoxyribonuclease RuvC